MNKIIVNSILALLTVGLAWACFWSIYSDISFDEERALREKAVKARLLQIKDAEELYKKTYGEYVGTLDSLIDFVKNGKAVAKIIKEGELSDDQLEAGMTEREAARQGLIRRDTIRTIDTYLAYEMKVLTSTWVVKVNSNSIILYFYDCCMETRAILALKRNDVALKHMLCIELAVELKNLLVNVKHKLILKFTIGIFARDDEVEACA